MRYVIRMLCAGLVHGDLSEFNVLVDEEGPVIIDLPQAVDASSNNNAQSMLARDIKNMTEYFGLFSPELLKTHYAEEIWSLYEAGNDIDAVMLEIKAALAEEEGRQERLRDAAQID
jgi:RIO kinase 1